MPSLRDRAMRDRVLPPGFLVGVNVCAHQFEGYGAPSNHTENDWTVYEQKRPSPISDGSDASVAVDHYNRYREDLELMASLGFKAFRFNVEWSRVEPQPGVYDAAALAHYVDVARHCRELGMEPMVTLQHFTLPLWLTQRGGLLADDVADRFAAYATQVARALGDHTRYWLTVNEPNVLAAASYISGDFPPKHRNPMEGLRASLGITRMHAAGATAIRAVATETGNPALVSLAQHIRPVVPRNRRSLLDWAVTVVPNYLFNRLMLNATKTGCFGPRVLGWVFRRLRVPGANIDYLGTNFYGTRMVHFDPTKPLFAGDDGNIGAGGVGDDVPITKVMRTLYRRYRLPIVITENGSTDPDAGRVREITREMAGVHRALPDATVERTGVDRVVRSFLGRIPLIGWRWVDADVRGYMHWAALDHWDWSMGFGNRMGLVAVDRTTQARTPKPSAHSLGGIAQTLTVTEKMQRDAGLSS